MGPNEILDKSILVTAPTPVFHVVRQTGVEEGAPVNTAGGPWLGVAQEDADDIDVANGRHLRVRVEGISTCVAADDDITFDDIVYADNTGRVTKTVGAGRVVGIARTSSAAVGDHISVQLTPGVTTDVSGG